MSIEEELKPFFRNSVIKFTDPSTGTTTLFHVMDCDVFYWVGVCRELKCTIESIEGYDKTGLMEWIDGYRERV